jgi:hypothetical protein
MRAKQLVMDKGIMSLPNSKPDKTLTEITVEVVQIFLGPEAASEISKVPLSADTFSHRVSDKSSDIEVILWKTQQEIFPSDRRVY